MEPKPWFSLMTSNQTAQTARFLLGSTCQQQQAVWTARVPPVVMSKAWSIWSSVCTIDCGHRLNVVHVNPNESPRPTSRGSSCSQTLFRTPHSVVQSLRCAMRSQSFKSRYIKASMMGAAADGDPPSIRLDNLVDNLPPRLLTELGNDRFTAAFIPEIKCA